LPLLIATKNQNRLDVHLVLEIVPRNRLPASTYDDSKSGPLIYVPALTLR
jgi:hypothetical protein